jgi:hypothetical protein
VCGGQKSKYFLFVRHGGRFVRQGGRLPQELWDQIGEEINCRFRHIKASIIFGFKLGDPIIKHESLWMTLFDSDKWLKYGAELGIDFVLVGADLDEYYGIENDKSHKNERQKEMKRKKKRTYMTLAAYSQSDRSLHTILHEERLLFFDCLNRHYVYKSGEVIFECGITLNVTHLMTSPQKLLLGDPLLLFNTKKTKEKVKTFYSFWGDPEKLLRSSVRDNLRFSDCLPFLELYLWCPGRNVRMEVEMRARKNLILHDVLENDVNEYIFAHRETCLGWSRYRENKTNEKGFKFKSYETHYEKGLIFMDWDPEPQPFLSSVHTVPP